MTAFYMFRLYFLTFEGEFRGNDEVMQASFLLLQARMLLMTTTPMAAASTNPPGRWPLPLLFWRFPLC